jgi:hypothetical protein
MPARSILKSRTGKVKITSLLLLVVLAAAIYYGIEVGGVYWRKYRLDDTLARDLSFAGQIADQTIHQRVLEHIGEMNLPIRARDVRFARTNSPRALRVSVSYTETVNLLFAVKEFPMSVDIQRPF